MTSAIEIEELAFRESDGIGVALLWDRGTGDVTVRVDDRRGQDRFTLTVAQGTNPLDVFYHPYAYAEERAGIRS